MRPVSHRPCQRRAVAGTAGTCVPCARRWSRRCPAALRGKPPRTIWAPRLRRRPRATSREVSLRQATASREHGLEIRGPAQLWRGSNARACVQPGHDDVLNAMLAQELLQVRVAERIALPFGHADGTGCSESRVPACPWAARYRGASSHEVPYDVARPERVSDLDNQVAAGLGLGDGGPGCHQHRLDLVSCDGHPPVTGKKVILEIEQQQRPALVRWVHRTARPSALCKSWDKHRRSLVRSL
jgi:hypothetical protein